MLRRPGTIGFRQQDSFVWGAL